MCRKCLLLVWVLFASGGSLASAQIRAGELETNGPNSELPDILAHLKVDPTSKEFVQNGVALGAARKFWEAYEQASTLDVYVLVREGFGKFKPSHSKAVSAVKERVQKSAATIRPETVGTFHWRMLGVPAFTFKTEFFKGSDLDAVTERTPDWSIVGTFVMTKTGGETVAEATQGKVTKPYTPTAYLLGRKCKLLPDESCGLFEPFRFSLLGSWARYASPILEWSDAILGGEVEGIQTIDNMTCLTFALWKYDSDGNFNRVVRVSLNTKTFRLARVLTIGTSTPLGSNTPDMLRTVEYVFREDTQSTKMTPEMFDPRELKVLGASMVKTSNAGNEGNKE